MPEHMTEYTYAATVATGDYLPYDGPTYHATAYEAWEYLADDRAEALGALDDHDPDATVRIMREAAAAVRMRAHLPGPMGEGTIRGTTPGYDGTYDQGATYQVAAIRGLVCPECDQVCPDAAALDDHGLAQHLETNTQ